ncbi:hypothetical protein GUJ93_ZPchr0010g10016 [Zizania palustris]|uniref:Uncharacterized protein n=1 Tax=Zizania palustris TaxID=103762 RepID=A0A8J5WCJ2_ZIZPA|nr:hypothetical protein GUJ93_ZPchr0010g10016 [Zizania palustris]
MPRQNEEDYEHIEAVVGRVDRGGGRAEAASPVARRSAGRCSGAVAAARRWRWGGIGVSTTGAEVEALGCGGEAHGGRRGGMGVAAVGVEVEVSGHGGEAGDRRRGGRGCGGYGRATYLLSA